MNFEMILVRMVINEVTHRRPTNPSVYRTVESEARMMARMMDVMRGMMVMRGVMVKVVRGIFVLV